MLTPLPSFTNLSDADLLAVVKRLARGERLATVHVIASLIELDTRRLYLGEGCSSLFAYCTRVLHLSEHAAYGRIEAARGARRFPLILELLADGSVTLTTVTLLAPLLTAENHTAVLTAARHKSKRDVEMQLAALRPRADVPAVVRRQPAPTTAPRARETESALSFASQARSISTPAAIAPAAAPPRASATSRPSVSPLAPERYRVQVTVGGETVAKLRRAQALMRHTIPSGDPAAIIDRALALLVEQLERTRLAATKHPRDASQGSDSRTRHVPAAVRRAVWARDGGRCTFAGPEGRCNEEAFLELHHIDPHALGGAATMDNLTLRCRAHNVYEAELEFGLRPGAFSRRERRVPTVREACTDYGMTA